MADTTYKAASWIFDSRGIMARPATDRPPDQHYYQSMTGCFEREESAISTRYGNIILNRDPNGTPGGTNYPLPHQPVTLARMLSLNGSPYRYAGLSDGSLWRRTGNTQGPYTSIATGLSGQQFTALVTTCTGSSQPYLFVYDRVSMLKDSGVGSPTLNGIYPPTQPAIATQYAPEVVIIEPFTSLSGFTTGGGLTIPSGTLTIVAGTTATPILNYDQYTDVTKSYINAIDGMIATSQTLADGAMRVKFNTNLLNNTYDIVALNGAYVSSDNFNFNSATVSLASNSVGYFGKTLAINLSNYQDDDLIVVAVQCDSPWAIQEIRVMFDVNGSSYGQSYYYKSLIPVSYQGLISDPASNDPGSIMTTAVYDQAIGITNQQQIGNPQNLPTNNPNLQQVQPSQINSGNLAWSVIYLPKGQFQPVGNAGEPGLDWSNITGWRIQITTNDNNGASAVEASFNGLYIQGSPTSTGVGTNAGASSYGGVGYDFRYTYWDNNTQTESNGSGENYFSATPQNPGEESTLVVLRQAIDLLLQYSANPAVTHVRIYARGGVYGNNWYYADQVPNIVGTAQFHYTYIIPDATLSQGNILSLTNDVPVTSTLQNPINTTITGALNPSPANTNKPTLLTISVANAAAVFVPYQIVDIGTPQNLEQTYVVTGGTGTFTAYISLPHAIGEQLQVFSTPGQPVFLAALAYGQVYMAGDKNNPHYLYYTPKGQPQYCPPQNYIPIGTPADPITAVINHRGVLFVRTYSTWYQIYPGSPPTFQTTGSKHGSPANFDWCLTESEVWYLAWDGIRTFRGADGDYRTLIIEWIFRNNPLSLIPLVNLNALGSVVSAFKNNTAAFSYLGQDGNRHRILYNTNYKRWRNDDIPATCMLTEPDTNLLVYAIPYPGLSAGNWAIVYDSLSQDYDDGGWAAGSLVQSAIPMNLQMPYMDLGALNNQKQFNVLTVDANPNNQLIDVQLLFDDNNGEVATIDLGNFTGAVRDKYQFIINAGFGQEAYKISPRFIASVKAAPIIYQMEISAAILADQRNSYDSYWHKFGNDESKLAKQGYFDYTTTDGNEISVQMFADGDTVPYYRFNLLPNTARAEVPIRVRFPAIKFRMLRVVMTSVISEGQFQLWSPIQIDQKPVIGPGSKGYERSDLGSLTT